MTTTTTTKSPVRIQGKKRVTPVSTGTADPRPLTDYAVAVSTVSGHTRITVTLSQPCIIRTPAWTFLSGSDNSTATPASVTVVDNKNFYFDFVGLLSSAINFIVVPYQDPQVQNFQGGFVTPGARWFRLLP